MSFSLVTQLPFWGLTSLACRWPPLPRSDPSLRPKIPRSLWSHSPTRRRRCQAWMSCSMQLQSPGPDLLPWKVWILQNSLQLPCLTSPTRLRIFTQTSKLPSRRTTRRRRSSRCYVARSRRNPSRERSWRLHCLLQMFIWMGMGGANLINKEVNIQGM